MAYDQLDLRSLAWREARERYAGWKDALVQFSLPLMPSLVFQGDRSWSAENDERCMRILLAQEPDIDAVFIADDQIAPGIIFVAHRLDVQIPQDLAVVGLDYIPESAFFTPPLTNIQDLFDVGYIAVDMLHKIIEARRRNEGIPNDFVSLLMP